MDEQELEFLQTIEVIPHEMDAPEPDPKDVEAPGDTPPPASWEIRPEIQEEALELQEGLSPDTPLPDVPPRDIAEEPGQAVHSDTVIAQVRPVLTKAPDSPPDQPPSGPEGGQGMRQLLRGSLGQYLIGEFLAGDRQLIRREGVLTQVGEDYLLLHEEASNTQLLCPLGQLQFLTMLPPGQRPQERPRQPQGRANTLYPPLSTQPHSPVQPPRRGPWW